MWDEPKVDVIWRAIPAFVSRGCGKARKISGKTVDIPEDEPGTSQMQDEMHQQLTTWHNS
jgi:hypothetical protein